MLSATPLAILAMVHAVAGATIMASAHRPRSTWLCHSPVLAVKKSQITGLPLRAESVTGVINSLPEGVITTCTSAPAFTSSRRRVTDLYAAIPPVMPNMKCRPLSMVLSQ